MNHRKLFKSHKNLNIFAKTPYKIKTRKKISTKDIRDKNSLNILFNDNDIIKEEKTEQEKNKMFDFTSPKKRISSKIRKKISTKEFFTPKKRNYFNIGKIFHRRTPRKLSHTNTKIFSQLIRQAIMKRQNDQERFQIIIKCLLNNVNTRTNEDIKMIKSFIKENKIVEEILFDKYNIENENLFNALSYEMEYKFIQKKEKLFEISDKVDNIYLIIKGKVEIYELVEYEVDMTLYKYIKFIYNFYNDLKQKESNINFHSNFNLEMYKLKKDIENNSDIIDIHMDDIPLLICLLIKSKLAYMISKNNYNIFSEDLEQIIIDCENDPIINLKNFEYDKDRRNDYFYIKYIINDLYKKLPKISQELMAKYYNVLSDKDEEYYSFKRYNLKKIKEIKDGDYLGENTLEKNCRKCSVIALEDTHLASIDYDLYSDIVNTYKEKIRDKEAKFLKESFYFKRISLQYFIKYYFYEFSYHELIHGNNILIQNQSVEYLYFLKEGIIEIYTNKSIVELIDLIKELSQKFKNYEEIKKELLNINSKLYVYGKINKYFLEKTSLRLLIIANTDILGLESWISNFPFFYNCKIISDKAKFYTIPVNKMNKLLDDYKEGKEELLSDSNKRLEVICKRLIKIVKTRIQYINKNTFNKNNQNEILNNKKQTNNLVLKNKFILSNEIKELLNIKTQKIKEKERGNINGTSQKLFYLTYTNINSEKSKINNITDMNKTEDNKFAKTQYLNRRNNNFSIRELFLKQEKENIKKKFVKKINNKKGFHLDTLNLEINVEDKKKNLYKKIYSIKGELKLLRNLRDVLEGELLLSHKKNFLKDSKKCITDNENNIRKAKTHIISKNPFEYINEEDFTIENEKEKEKENIAHPRKMSFNKNIDYYNLTLNTILNHKQYDLKNSITHRKFSENNKNINNNNIFQNSQKGINSKLSLFDKNSFQYNNSKQKSLKIFFDNNDKKRIQEYKYRLKQKKYCLTEREVYKKKIYKIMQKKIKETNYFYDTFK